MIKIKRVYEENGKFFAVSDQSPFYPDGKGGQLGDRGKIGPANVLNVQETSEHEIVHILDRFIEPGEYDCVIDQLRQKDIAIQHTAQHILSASFLKVAQAGTVSFHMGEESSTIDLDMPQFTIETLKASEELANEIVRKCVDVEILQLDREEAEKMNLRKALSEKVTDLVRIVKIDDFDTAACGGYHVKNTGEIGVIKVVSWEKTKRSLTRVYFLAGNRAVKDYNKKVLVLRELSKLLTSSVDEMQDRIEGLLNKIKDQASLIKRLSEELAKVLREKLETHRFKGYTVSTYEGFDEVAYSLAKYFQTDLLICKTSEGYLFASKGIDCSKLIESLKRELPGTGGGGARRGTFKTPATWKELLLTTEKFLEVI